MPILPGSDQPLTLVAPGAKKRAKGTKGANAKGAKSAKGGGNTEDVGTPPKKKRKTDDELQQLDLKRHQLTLRRNAVPCLFYIGRNALQL